MPFRFLAEIETSDGRALWARTIYHLSTITDTIKFSIRQARADFNAVQSFGTVPKTKRDSLESFSCVSLTGINLAKTSLLNCCFRAEFFSNFQIDGDLPFEASETDSNRARCFSFLVNSKNLNTLFGDCGDNTRKFKMLIIDAADVEANVENFQRSDLFNNKLFVEFETKSQMTKNYKLSFVQSKESFDLKIRDEMFRILEEQKNEDEFSMTPGERMNYLMVDPSILKRFLIMFPSNLEDFRIELFSNVDKVLFYGYNRQEAVSTTASSSGNKKDTSAALTPSMSLSIQVGLKNLDYSNVKPIPGEENDFKLIVSHRLRELKTFINLIATDNHIFGSTTETMKQQFAKRKGKYYLENNNMMDSYNDVNVTNDFGQELPSAYITTRRVPPLHIIFNSDGPFALFERRYESADRDADGQTLKYCQMALILMIDQEADKVVLDSKSNNTLPVPSARSTSNLTNDRSSKTVSRSENAREPLFVQDEENDDNMERDQVDLEQQEMEQNQASDEPGDYNGYGDNPGLDNDDPTREITDDQAKDKSLQLQGSKRKIVEDDLFWDNSKYHQVTLTTNTNKANANSTKLSIQNKDAEEEEDTSKPVMFVNLGPTQNITRVRGIFD